jgi:hypothetical protein
VGTSYCRNVLQDDHSSRRAPDTSAPFILPSLHGLRDRNAQSRELGWKQMLDLLQRSDEAGRPLSPTPPHERSSREQHGRDAGHAPPRCLPCPARPFGDSCLPALSMCPELRKARPTRAAITASGITPRLHSRCCMQQSSLGDDGNRSPHPPPFRNRAVRRRWREKGPGVVI